MELEIKRPEHIVPSYSLTGDLLSYMRCRLQYRYHNGSALPPSRPVQQWFGEFLHGTLELGYQFWASEENIYSFPWPCNKKPWYGDLPAWDPNDIGKFANQVEVALRQQGKQVRSSYARDSAYHRVERAINLLGPDLFPLIDSAEKKVIGSREVPTSNKPLRCSNYEVHGVIDVLTSMSLGNVKTDNIFSQNISEICPDLEGQFEVIVDYKGAERPSLTETYWEQGKWQVETYAWLRSRQPESLPVGAGILIYVNELTPGDNEMEKLQKAWKSNNTDVLPERGSKDEQIIRLWRKGESGEQLSIGFRLRRAIRVVRITPVSIQEALNAFDQIVRDVEEDIVSEADGLPIVNAWYPTSEDSSTCVACDFRHFCPKPAGTGQNYSPQAPKAP